jgi:hypothetical protein
MPFYRVGRPYSDVKTPVPGGTDFMQYHTYGFLWVPATGSSMGYGQFYFGRNPVGKKVRTAASSRAHGERETLGYWSSPKMANVLVVPMNTRPPPTVGAMNLLPGPNWSRPPVAWLLL